MQVTEAGESLDAWHLSGAAVNPSQRVLHSRMGCDSRRASNPSMLRRPLACEKASALGQRWSWGSCGQSEQAPTWGGRPLPT